MVKLLFYIGIFILICYVLDYFYIKSRESFRELKQAYKDLKNAEQDLHNLLKDKEL